MLSIKTLKIKNFRSISEIELNTLDKERIIVISGKNGQGKSSIIEALRFLLTGKLEEKLSDYIKEGEEYFDIQLDFLYNKVNYSFQVHYSGKETSKRLIFNSMTLYNSDAQEYVIKQIDGSLLDYAVISLQGETASLLFQKPTERLETIKKIFNITFLDEKLELLAEKEKGIKDENKSLKIEQDFLSSKTFSLMEEKPFDFSKEEILFNIEKEEQKQKDYQSFILKKSSFDNDLRTYKNTQQEKIKIEKELNRLKELENKVISITLPDFRKIGKDLNTLELTVESFRNSLYEKNLELKNEEKKLDLSSKGKCPECGQDTRLERNHLKDLNNKIESIKKDLEELNNQLSGANKELTSKRKEMDAFNKLSQEKALLETQIEEIKKFNYEEKMIIFNSVKEPENLQEVENNQKELSLWQKRLTEYEMNEKYNKEISELNKKTLEEESNNRQNILNIQEKMEQNDTELSMIRKVKKMTKDFTGYLISKGTEFIKTQMNNFFIEVYGGRYHVSYENNGSTINFYYGSPSKNMRSVSLASGFEKSLLGISFRMALMEMKKYGLMLLDEIDNFADSSKSSELFRCVLDYKNLNQVFIVSHNEDTKEYLENNGAKFFEIENGLLKN